MSIYSVFLKEPSSDEWVSLKEKYPNRHFIAGDRLAFVAPEGVSLTSEIGKTVGFDEEKEIAGIIMEISNYNGYFDADLWEWLSKIA